MDSYYRSCGIRYHIFDTRPHAEFKGKYITWRALSVRPGLQEGEAVEGLVAAGAVLVDGHLCRRAIVLGQAVGSLRMQDDR